MGARPPGPRGPFAEPSPTRGKNARFGGREKGTPNKTTRVAKEAMSFAFDELGGAEALVKWVRSDPANEKAFYMTMWPKLLPLQVTGEGGGPVAVTEVVRLVIDPKTQP
jgi:hypothetical protein